MQARLEAEKKRAEEAKAAALETERKAAKEAEKKIAAEDSARSAAAAAVVPSKEATGSPKRASLGTLNDQSNKSVSDGVKTVQQAGCVNSQSQSPAPPLGHGYLILLLPINFTGRSGSIDATLLCFERVLS